MRPQSRVTASAEECTTVAVCVTIPFWEGRATRIPEWNLGKNVVVVPDDEAELWEVFRGKLDISVYDEVSFKRLVV